MDRNDTNGRATTGVIAATVIIAMIALLALAGLGGVSCAVIDEDAGGREGEIAGAAVSATSVTNSINYQGRMTDSAGEPLSGTYNMTFGLYNAPTGVKYVLLDTDTHTVEVTDGLFNTNIDFAPSYFDGRALWLGITVKGDSEMTPRQELRAVPYALSLRPGAKIAGNVRGPALWVENEGNLGEGVWVDTTGNSGRGVYARTYGNGSHGVAADIYGYRSNGVYARTYSDDSHGVYASTAGDDSDGFHAYTYGDDSHGVYARTYGNDSDGVYAHTAGDGSDGVHAYSTTGTGVYGGSGSGHGVFAQGAGQGLSGAALYARASDAGGIALWGNSTSTDSTLVLRNDGTGDLIRAFSHDDWAYRFRVDNDGRTTVNVLEITGGSDLSEQFDIHTAERDAVPGALVSIDPEHPGQLTLSRESYDRRVAGIISGAGGIQTGMLMGQEGSQADGSYPVALSGRVYCWADASNSPIEPGDLLTTSDIPGHAMKVTDYTRAQGAAIGKAMSSLDEGQGLVLVLITLQ